MTANAGRRALAGVLPGVAMAIFHVAMIDLPRADVVAALDSDRYRIQWITGTFLAGSAGGMALTRFVAGLLGLRWCYLAGVVLFGAAAGLCGCVSEVVWMAPCRVVQGFGMGLLICSGMVLLWRAFPERKERAMALYGLAVYLPALAGATAGGLLTVALSWRLIFLINPPLALVTGCAAWWLLPADRPARPAVLRFDWLGLALFLSWVVALNVVLDMGQYWGWLNSPFFVPWLAAFVVSFAGFVARGVLAREPVIDLKPFALRNFALGIGVKALFSVNLYVLVALLSAYMIGQRGYQWWQGSLVLLPALAAMGATAAAGARWGTAGNRRARMLLGTAGMALATWQLSALDLYTAKQWLALYLALWGAAAGLVVGPALVTIFEGLTPEQTLHGAGIFNVTRALPAFVAGGVLATLLTQTSDAYFDSLRQNIRYNRPVVEQTTGHSLQHFTDRGGAVPSKQAHALLGKWAHANARAFALQTVLRYLTLATALAPVLVLFVRRHGGPV